MSTTPEKMVPVYIPWETFVEFIAHLKATVVPTRIDKSAMPDNMPGLIRGQIQSALRFLRLIDSNDHRKDSLVQLVSAYETPKWTDAIEQTVLPPYIDIIGDLDLDNTTQHQLDERFKAVGVSGQMLLKSIRFYLAALGAAGLTFSPHLSARRKRLTAVRRKLPQAKGLTPKLIVTEDHQNRVSTIVPAVPEGTRSYPLYFRGKPSGAIVVPIELSVADCKVIELQLAVLKAYAATDYIDEQ